MFKEFHFQVLLLLLLVMIATTVAQFAQINYDILLSDKDYVDSQLSCVLGKNPANCDKIGNRFRQVLPEAAKTGKCLQCNDQEKIYIVKVGRLIKSNYTKEWNELLDIYKVEPSFREEFLQKEQA